jgi:hypothetical protein
VFAVGAVVLLLGVSPVASATSGPEAVALLNLQRAANGIPGNLVEDPQLTQGCLEYDHYRALNPSEPPHHEIVGHAGYTPLGASAHGEVNAFVDIWTATANPWDTAPIHQWLMFDPTVSTAGYAFSEGTACMRFDSGGPTPLAPAFYSFVNDAGPGAVPFSETAYEAPFVPQQLVGIAPATTTGPNILAFASGFGGARVASVGLTIAGGPPVPDVRFVDSATSGVSGFFGNAADIIPVGPLEPGTAYTLTVNWQNDSGPIGTQTVNFTTALRDNSVALSAEVQGPTISGDQTSTVRIHVASDAPQAELSLSGPTQLSQATAAGEVVLNLVPGRWIACVASGGPGTGYKPGRSCTAFVVTGYPRLTLAPQLIRRSRPPYAVLTAASQAAGQRATIVTQYLPGRCRIHRCPTSHVHRSTTKTIVLHVRQKVAVGIVLPGDRVIVTVTTPAFTLAGAPYVAGQATRAYR